MKTLHFLRKNTLPSIEPLEPRIAPAAVFTFTDVDGDIVTVKTSKGTNADLAAVLTFSDPAAANPRQLQTINLSSSAGFAGTDLSVTAKRGPTGGDGRVNVGYIDATSSDGGALLDLGKVTVAGDLGRILAGDATTTTPAVKLLAVHSIGEFGTNTQGAGASLITALLGGAKTVKVVGSVVGVDIGMNLGGIGTLTIGGSLLGGANFRGGWIFASGDIGVCKIGGSIIGGSGDQTGQIYANGKIGVLQIAGSVFGGSSTGAGYITAFGDVGSIVIGGSLIGGTDDDSGAIALNAKIGKLAIGGSFIGGSKDGAGTLSRSGYITAQTLGTLTVGGSILAGSETGGGVLVDSGNVRIGKTIGSITVGGDIRGRLGQNVIISANGAEIPGKLTDIAIGKITVKGRVERTDILAGYNTSGIPVNADAQIGTVTVGDFIASNLIAGVHNNDGFFGDSNDFAITINDDPAIKSRIAAVIIRGQVIGTPSSTDASTFAIAAQQIGSVKLGTTIIPLQSGASNDTFAAARSQPLSGSLGVFAFISAGPDVRAYEV